MKTQIGLKKVVLALSATAALMLAQSSYALILSCSACSQDCKSKGKSVASCTILKGVNENDGVVCTCK